MLPGGNLHGEGLSQLFFGGVARISSLRLLLSIHADDQMRPLCGNLIGVDGHGAELGIVDMEGERAAVHVPLVLIVKIGRELLKVNSRCLTGAQPAPD